MATYARLAHLVTAVVVTTAMLPFVSGDDCTDLNYYRSRKQCKQRFEDDMRRSANVTNFHTSRHIACCGVMWAKRCIDHLTVEKSCIDESNFELLANFDKRVKGRDCDRYDYRQCNAAGTVIASAFLLAVGLCVTRLLGTV